MTPAIAQLQEVAGQRDAARLLATLEKHLRDQRDRHALFYALLLQKRVELGLPPVQVGRADDVPEDVRGPYEDGIRQAAREVGKLLLADGDIASAWPYFRMIGEPEDVAKAIEGFVPNDDEGEKIQQVIEIALHEGVHPRRGFELLLERYGICTSITTLGQLGNLRDEERNHCIRKLIRALHRELRERLAYDLQRRELAIPPDAAVADLLATHPEIMAEDAYHVDVSHLSSVVQFSTSLPPCDELRQAIELCEYGERLSPKFKYRNDPPFENQYADYKTLLKTLAGIEVEQGLEHFRGIAARTNPDEYGTLAAEVYVNLLARVGRPADAARAYVEHLATTDPRRLNCPRLEELCGRTGDYQPLVDCAAKRDDPVNFVAGLLQQWKQP